MKHKIYSASLSLASGIRKLRLLHHGHSTNVLLFVHHLIEEQVLHELLSKHRPLVLCFRGDNEIRTRDPLLARQVLSQLSYTPRVGLNGLEPSTSRLSGVRSNQLSYKPICGGDKGIRTLDPLRARQVLSQLSYTPTLNEKS